MPHRPKPWFNPQHLQNINNKKAIIKKKKGRVNELQTDPVTVPATGKSESSGKTTLKY